MTTSSEQSRESVIGIAVLPDAKQDPVMKSTGRGVPADKDVLYTKQSEGKCNGCHVKLSEVRMQPACPLLLKKAMHVTEKSNRSTGFFLHWN